MAKLKLLLSILISIFFVVGCASTQYKTGNITTKKSTEKTLKEINMDLTELNKWQMAYYDILNGNKENIDHTIYDYTQLYDLDFDNIPELLFFKYSSNAPRALCAIITFKNGKVTVYDLADISQNFGCVDLYLDKNLNELVWVSSSYNNTPEASYNEVYSVDFRDLGDLKTDTIYECKEEHATGNSEYTIDGKKYTNNDKLSNGADIQKKLDEKIGKYVFVPECQSEDLWIYSDNYSSKIAGFLKSWNPISEKVKENTKLLENIPKVWNSQNESTIPNKEIGNYNLMKVAYAISLDYEVESFKVHEWYFDSEHLVVAHLKNKKVVLGEYDFENLNYVMFPKEELLDDVYSFEGIYNYNFNFIPKEFLLDLQNNNFDYDENLVGVELNKEEFTYWVDEYYKQYNEIFPNYEALDVINNGYKVDITNDGLDDIVLTAVLGNGGFEYIETIVNNGNGNYKLVKPNYINNYDFDGKRIFSYKDENYIVTFGYGPANFGKQLVNMKAENNEITQQIFNFENYDIGFAITNEWSKNGYEKVIKHIKTRAFLGNTSKPSVMGIAETWTAKDGIYNLEYEVIADYNNDGVKDKVLKGLTGTNRLGDMIFMESDDQKLGEILNEILYKSNNAGIPQCVFLDQTEYGNVLIIAYGFEGEIYNFCAYKIVGYEYELIGKVDVETIDFETVEEVEFDY